MTIGSVGRFHFLEQARALAEAGEPVRHFCDDPRVVSLGPHHGSWLPGLMLEFRYWAPRDLSRAYRSAGARLSRAIAGRSKIRVNSGFAWEALARDQAVIVDHGSLHEAHMRRVLLEEARAWQEPLMSRCGNQDRAWLVERQATEFDRAHGVIVASERAKSSLIEQGVSRRKIAVAPLGVDPDRFRPINRTGETRRPFRILHAGPLTFTKGIHRLIRAFGAARMPGAELWLAGRFGSEAAADWFRRQARGLRVRFLPPVPQGELPRLFSRVDGFVLASLGDGFGLTVLQAMASGLPAVLSDRAGCAEVIGGCPSVAVVDMSSEAGLMEALERLPGLGGESFRVASRLAASRLGWRRHAEALVRAMESIG